jgi:integrase
VISPADVEGLPEELRSDPNALMIDFRRRKRGRIRRVIVLLPVVADMMRRYERPERSDGKDDGLFFHGRDGLPLEKWSESGPQNWITRWFVRLATRAGLRKSGEWKEVDGVEKFVTAGSGDRRGFKSLRTTCANAVPSEFATEGVILMGHAKGGVLLDNYLETHGLAKLSQLSQAIHERLPLACALKNPLAPTDGSGPAPAYGGGGAWRARAKRRRKSADASAPPPPSPTPAP